LPALTGSHGSRKPFTFASLGLTVKNVEELVITQTGNQDPLAVDDTATTDEDASITVDLLDNDSDPDGDTLTVTAVTQGANGTVVDNNDGTVTYTPNANFSGSDSFSYTIDDGNGGTSTAAVGVTVDPVNDAPVFDPAVFDLDEGQTAVGTITATDADATGPLTFSLTANAATDNGLFTCADFQRPAGLRKPR